MRLSVPCEAIDFKTRDIYGQPFVLSGLSGKRIMLSFFRDAACPFCNFRIYELTNQYDAWKQSGLEIVAVFSSPAKEVRKHVARHPRPFRMISDPTLSIYSQYGIEQSTSALLRAMLFKAPRIIRGIATGGRPRPNPHVKIVPADFLVDIEGRISDLWYGRDTADHIPLARVESFVNQASFRTLQDAEREIEQLKAKNKQLLRVVRKFRKQGGIEVDSGQCIEQVG